MYYCTLCRCGHTVETLALVAAALQWLKLNENYMKGS